MEFDGGPHSLTVCFSLFFVLVIKFYKTKDLRHYVRATLLNYEDDTTECKRP